MKKKLEIILIIGGEELTRKVEVIGNEIITYNNGKEPYPPLKDHKGGLLLRDGNREAYYIRSNTAATNIQGIHVVDDIEKIPVIYSKSLIYKPEENFPDTLLVDKIPYVLRSEKEI